MRTTLIAAREPWRAHSIISPALRGTLQGLGWRSYTGGLRALVELAAEAQVPGRTRAPRARLSRSCGGADHRLASQEGRQVLFHALRHRGACLVGVAGQVRQQHHVVESEQGFGHTGLVLEHVEAGTGDALVLQRIDQGGLIHHGAA